MKLLRRTPQERACTRAAMGSSRMRQTPPSASVSTVTRKGIILNSSSTTTCCGKGDWEDRTRFNLDHVQPRAQGGATNAGNLGWACQPCNQAKGAQRSEAFLENEPERLERIRSRKRTPLAAAGKQKWLCDTLVERLQARDLTVTQTTGADTAAARRSNGIAKSHANDAACADATERRARQPERLQCGGSQEDPRTHVKSKTKLDHYQRDTTDAPCLGMTERSNRHRPARRRQHEQRGTHRTPHREPRIENLDHLVEDNRDICFEQGKPCVYQDEDQPDHIITEWPNGVVDTKDLVTGNVVREWPDGRSEALTGQTTVPRLPRHPTDACRN